MLTLTTTPTWTAKVHPANLMVASEGHQTWTVRVLCDRIAKSGVVQPLDQYSTLPGLVAILDVGN